MLRNLTRPVETWRGLSAIIDNNTLIFKSYTLEIVVQIFDTFANDLDIRPNKNKSTLQGTWPEKRG